MNRRKRTARSSDVVDVTGEDAWAALDQEYGVPTADPLLDRDKDTLCQLWHCSDSVAERKIKQAVEAGLLIPMGVMSGVNDHETGKRARNHWRPIAATKKPARV